MDTTQQTPYPSGFDLSPTHVGVSVSDIDRSVQWYGDVFGFSVISRRMQPTLKAEVCFLERDGFQIELLRYEAPKPLPPGRLHPDDDLQTIGTKHIAFRTRQFAQLLGHLQRHKVDIVVQKQINNRQIAFIRDPDGILIEIICIDLPQK